ncbi:Stealth protein CR1, conserved region 1 [Paramicrobacterium humi]|uniref:Stealth protein CR1, conserved region 1 n=1 Tax=Paramicrobacterium humi TaxID=640635 RepID=A0A1H4KGT9_9MICO|nr:stealth conserved region 3 domain-containing protein [Microbacterium humi]SEB57774.1 Stealth protein CR1, conserved region 1 [Microbacterium humi]
MSEDDAVDAQRQESTLSDAAGRSFRVEAPLASGLPAIVADEGAPAAHGAARLLTDEPLVVPSRERRFEREDVVHREGRYALTVGHFTPHQSMVEDLLAVADALEQAGIDFLLARSSADRPIIAVDRRRRRDVEAAFSTAFAHEPFYALTLKKEQKRDLSDAPYYSVDDDLPTVLLADGRLSPLPKAKVFRLYRPRLEPIGRLRYGPESAPQLELWAFGDETIIAPTPNALTRRHLARSEAAIATITRWGREWPTLENMFADLASDVTFDIDVVFSWVDGSSVEYRRRRAARMAGVLVGEGDDSEARFRQIDELKYALRSIYMFAPWVRRIFIATDSPAPRWLKRHPRVMIVPAEKHFADPSVLPTYNSHAVESQLHHIPGLAEHFLYSNDDMFFGRQVSPSLFFSPGGVTKFVEARTRIGLGDTDPTRSGYENAARVNRELLRGRFGKITTRHLEHCAAPLRVSVLNEMEQEFAEEFRRTAASRFRSATDISVTNSLYHYYALMTGRAVVQTQARVRYIETTLRSAAPAMERLLRKRDQDMFCLNDGSKPEISDEERTENVTAFLERYFPFPAPWEKDSADSARADELSLRLPGSERA